MRHFEFDEDFYMRVRHNFKLYVLLSSRRLHWNERVILESICRLSGYKCHKTVKYGEFSSHIHVRFEEEYLAEEAIEFLNKMNSDLTAVPVDDMLRDWFTYEMKSGFGPPCTLTIVDIIGDTPFALNFLTSNILDSIFQDFGRPYLLPYTAALNEPHVQVLFGSMTEALAASMAFGEWYKQGYKVDSFFHRVRINPSEKEALLIGNSGGVPKEAFKLDYFINVRSEVFPSRRRYGFEAKQDKNPRSRIASHSKGREKVHKHQKHSNSVVRANSESSLVENHCNGFRTPILCFPIIASLNYNTEAMVSTSKQLGMDLTNALLNFQRSCSISTQTVVASGESSMEIGSSIKYCRSEETITCAGVVDGKLDQPDLPPLEQEIAKDPAPPPPLPLKHIDQSAAKQKTSRKGSTRVFERRR